MATPAMEVLRAPSLLLLLLLFVSAPVLSIVQAQDSDDNGQQQSKQQPKIDCHPLNGANEQRCAQYGCIWSPVANQSEAEAQNTKPRYSTRLTPNAVEQITQIGLIDTPKSDVQEPWCSFPADYEGYKVVSASKNGRSIALRRTRPSSAPDDVTELKVELEHLGKSVLKLKIFDANKARHEPELPKINRQPDDSLGGPSDFAIKFDKSSGHLSIVRRSNGAKLFETDLRKLIFADKFIQLNSKLNSMYVYGLGEHLDTFLKLADRYKTFSFWAMDRLPLPDGRRSYGSFPFYINLDSGTKQAHGVYLRNSNAMDIVLQADQSITFRPIGGVLEFYLFAGPTANDVIKQYQNLVGLPDLPPRWSLGFHLCRYGYNSIENMITVWNRTRASGIPFDVQWTDIDSMHKNNDFTYDTERFRGLPEFVDHLHKLGQHYMTIFDPGLTTETDYKYYTLGRDLDVFVKNATNQTLIGKVWNDVGQTVFPDFSNPKTQVLWTTAFKEFHKQVQFDGAWIDMNEVSNDGFGSLDGCPMDHPDEQCYYKPSGDDLQVKTVCLSARHRAGIEYNVHNLYAFYEAIATSNALKAVEPNKRPFIISRASSPGQGHFGGHWSGDVISSWDYLRWSVASLVEHNIYGFNMMGTDICGFNGDTNPELCARWSTLGAFYTFSRNHNDKTHIDQDPVALGSDVVEANRNALTMKYRLLPYLYTLIHKAHRFGEPATRSMALQWHHEDPKTLDVEDQFTWADGLIVSPIVDQGTFSKKTYLPKGRWYERGVLPDQPFKVIESKGEWHETVNISLSDIALFFRGSKIFPFYENVAQTTTETVKQPISLMVLLCPMNRAHGDLINDDGENVDNKYDHIVFKFENKKLTGNLIHEAAETKTELGIVVINGITFDVKQVISNGKDLSFKRDNDKLKFDLKGLKVTKEAPLLVELV